MVDTKKKQKLICTKKIKFIIYILIEVGEKGYTQLILIYYISILYLKEYVSNKKYLQNY